MTAKKAAAAKTRRSATASRRQLEKTHDALTKQYNALVQDFVSQLQQVVEEKPEAFMRAIARSVLEGPASQEAPVVELPENSYLRRCYRDMAEWILLKLDKKNVANPENEFISLRDRAFDRGSTPHLGRFKVESIEWERIAQRLFGSLEEQFRNGFWDCCELVYHGVPLYVTNDKSGHPSLLEFSHQDYAVMCYIGEYCPDIRTGNFPHWINKYSFKSDHVAAHNIFFHGDLPDSEGINAIRKAFRLHIGFDEKSLPQASRTTRPYQTRLLGYVDEVIERYYGEGFDPSNRDTWNKQDVIVEWLMDTYKLSKRAARAIAVVTTPDSARNC